MRILNFYVLTRESTNYSSGISAEFNIYNKHHLMTFGEKLGVKLKIQHKSFPLFKKIFLINTNMNCRKTQSGRGRYRSR